MNQKLRKWLRWLQVIRDDVQQLVIHKDIFEHVRKIIEANPRIQIPNAFYDFMGGSYAAYAAMGIRRQARYHKDSISFIGLLGDIADNPHALTRGYYVSLYGGPGITHLADKEFDRFSGTGGAHIDPTLVRRDIRRLEARWREVREFIDRRIAHHDRKAVAMPSGYRDIDACIDLLDELYCRYHLLLNAKAITSLKPDCQDDWKEIFRHRWIGGKGA